MTRDFGGPTPEEMGIKEGAGIKEGKGKQLAILEQRCADLTRTVEELRAIIDVVQKRGGDLGGIQEENQLATLRSALAEWSHKLLRNNKIELTHEELAGKEGVVSIDGLTQEELLSAIAKSKIVIGPKGVVGEAYAKKGIVFNEGIRGTKSDPRNGEKLDAWVFNVPGDFTDPNTKRLTPGDPKRVKGSTSQMRVLFIDSKDNLAVTDIYSKKGNFDSARHELYGVLLRAGFTNLPFYDPSRDIPQYADLHSLQHGRYWMLSAIEQVHNKLNTEI